MSNHEFIDEIVFFNGKKIYPYPVLEGMGVRLDVYAPDDGRVEPMTVGECGCFISQMRCMEYVVKNSIDSLLVFEDDAVLSDNFEEFLTKSTNDLPDSWDFLSFYSYKKQNFLSDSSDIGSPFIHKCLSQFSYTATMLYSRNGAERIIKLFKRLGATYNVDSIMYRASHAGTLNGYIVRPDIDGVVSHNIYGSLIDPENSRKNES